ncbi:MAG: cell division protein SepF [Candidatus Syntrophonatronum acetioxidans]|uniref:Cell division protein SepF n=1 Tax=Candidatus Syntrophonatronum acetioxidans TaxID=1795816 RepID=A0A424Y9X1_9FIRM|nr:MAG: cell division protein SepF [Candidatus Syntrophonatronum acetioxidans]
MGFKFFEKILVFLGLAEEEEEENNELGTPEESRHSSSRRGKVVSLHTSKNLRVMVTEPTDYDEAQSIAENLKNKFPVVVNLEQADLDTAKRIIDFVSGAAFAINGNFQKVSSNIFIFTPPNVDINATMSRSEVEAFTGGTEEGRQEDE